MNAITKFGKIDFEGQKIAERLGSALLISSGIAALAVGKVTDNLLNTVYVYLGGVVFTLLAVSFPLPIYKRNPVRWLDDRKDAKSEAKAK